MKLDIKDLYLYMAIIQKNLYNNIQFPKENHVDKLKKTIYDLRHH
jgi:hypothetical protein